MKLSAVVLTKNEEENIRACLNSLSFCDEVIVIDDESSDQTVEIAKRYKAKVFSRSLNGNFADQRNFALEKAKGEWVLFVDADERVSKDLERGIVRSISSRNSRRQNLRGFLIKRIDIMWGKKLIHGEMGDVKLLRLARKDGGKWEGKVHERWIIDGKIGILNSLLLHYPHQTVAEFLRDINFYTDLRAKELYKKGLPADKASIHVYPLSIILYPLGKFAVNYIFKGGFLDGTAGLLVAMIMSFHSFLVRGKLWLIWSKERK